VRACQYVRLTKSRKVSVKNCAQIVANMVREHGQAFAIDGYALLLDALLPFVSLTHHGWLPYRSPLVAALSQPWAHLGPLLAAQKHQRSALSLAVKSTVRQVVLWESLLGTK